MTTSNIPFLAELPAEDKAISVKRVLLPIGPSQVLALGDSYREAYAILQWASKDSLERRASNGRGSGSGSEWARDVGTEKNAANMEVDVEVDVEHSQPLNEHPKHTVHTKHTSPNILNKQNKPNKLGMLNQLTPEMVHLLEESDFLPVVQCRESMQVSLCLSLRLSLSRR